MIKKPPKQPPKKPGSSGLVCVYPVWCVCVKKFDVGRKQSKKRTRKADGCARSAQCRPYALFVAALCLDDVPSRRTFVPGCWAVCAQLPMNP